MSVGASEILILWGEYINGTDIFSFELSCYGDEISGKRLTYQAMMSPPTLTWKQLLIPVKDIEKSKIEIDSTKIYIN